MINSEKNIIYKSIMVSGANGFTGKLVCNELKARGKDILCNSETGN